MNYYFRRGNTSSFWYWTSRSAEMAYGDLTPVFALTWEMTQDEAMIRSHLPVTGEGLRNYLAYLLAKHPEAAAPVARQLASGADSIAVPVLLEYCDRFAGTDPPSALTVWNSLCSRKLIPYRSLNPATGAVITNGNFDETPGGRGYDWRLATIAGVSLVPAGDATGTVAICRPVRANGTRLNIGSFPSLQSTGAENPCGASRRLFS